MILFGQMKKSASIDTLYTYAKSNNITLFPTEDFDFWAAYEAAYQKFDRYFYQKYRAFKVMQDYDTGASDADMLADFKSIIDAHFFINAKRYSELYRVQVLAADAYDVVNNYDLNETITRTNTGTVEDARGARSDSATKGAASTQTAYGARSSSNATTLGNQTSTSTQSRSAFNAGDMVEVQGGNIANGARSDSATLTEQAHTDATTEAARTDSSTIGAQTNTRTDDLEENTTIRRYGNIGVQTPADVIGGHIDLWQAFKFYQMIFDEIAAEYLIIDVDFDFYTAPATGSGSDVQLLQAINEVKAQLTEVENIIMDELEDVRIDITDVHENVHDAEANIRGDIGTLSAKTTTDTNNIRADINTLSAKTTTDTNNIRGDIMEVVTNGY